MAAEPRRSPTPSWHGGGWGRPGVPHHPKTPRAATYQLPLVAEAESADLFGLGVLGVAGRGAAAAVVVEGGGGVARLPVAARLPHQQHVPQVGDVAGGQSQGLDLGELSVGRLGGDEGAEGGEGGVDAVGAVALPRVGRVTLPGLPVDPVGFFAAPPFAGLDAVAVVVGFLVGAGALAAVLLVLGQHADLGVQVPAGGRAQHGEGHGGAARGRRGSRVGTTAALCRPPPAAAGLSSALSCRFPGRGPAAAPALVALAGWAPGGRR